jgi:uncharacterized protein YggE
MRLAGLTAALALLGAVPAVAQTATPLAPGEVLLEVDAAGTVHSRPDAIRLFVVAKSTGETAGKARAANAALVERISAAARSAGVDAADIRPGSGPWWRVGFISDPSEAALPAFARPSGRTETAMLDIRLRDAAKAEAVRTAVEQAGADAVQGPVYALENDSTARRAAKEDAVRRARVDAEEYAGALGMQVARILRVSERTGPAADPAEVEAMFATMNNLGNASAGEIETRVRIAVDFALAPRR